MGGFQMTHRGWRAPAPKISNHARSRAAALVSLALVAGLLGGAAPTATAVEDEDHVDLPTTGYVPEVVATSGAGIILGTDEETSYRVSADGGTSWSALEAPAFTADRVRYVAGGKVVYVEDGQGDGAGDYSNVYGYDFAAAATAAPIRVDFPELLAVNPDYAVVSTGSGIASVQLAGGTQSDLTIDPQLATAQLSAANFSLDSGPYALVSAPHRDAGALGDGFLDAVPLAGGADALVVVPGLVTAGLRGSQAVYVTGDATAARLCLAAVDDLAGAGCQTLQSGDFSHATASLDIGPDWVVVHLSSSEGQEAADFVHFGSDASGAAGQVVPSASMLSLSVFGRGDTEFPLAGVVTAEDAYVGSYEAAGEVSRSFGVQTPVTTRQLFLTQDRVSGVDDRPVVGATAGQAWTRHLSGVEIGAETLLQRGKSMTVSGSRTLISGAAGTQVWDAGELSGTLPAIDNARSMSGPYFLSGPDDQLKAFRVDGTQLDSGPVLALFGSLALKAGAGAGQYQVVDLAVPSKAAVAFDLDAGCADTGLRPVGLWGKWVLAAGADEASTAVLDYQDPDNCYQHAGKPLAIGDGFALVSPNDPDTDKPELVAWNFLHDQDGPVAKDPTSVATDGSHNVAWTTGTELHTASLDDLVTPAAPRVLGILAAATVVQGQPWSLQLDATKALRGGGVLVIRDSSGADVWRADLPEAADGSLRNVVWTNTAGVVVGTYTWELLAQSSDTGANLIQADGTAGVTGSVQVKAGTLAKVTGSTPTLSTTHPAVGRTVKAIPGTWKPSPVTLEYQWFRDSTGIYGATAASYKVDPEDLGHRLSVRVTGSAAGRAAVSKTSSRTSTVVRGSLTAYAPTLDVKTPKVNQTVTATTPAWKPGIVELTYQWYKVSSSGRSYKIVDATNASYQAQGTDAGYRLKVKAIGRQVGYNTKTAYSAKTGYVLKVPFDVADAPTITGTPQVKSGLTAVPGEHSPTATFKYQWYRGTSAISNATLPTYTLKSADLGKAIKVRVTARRVGYVTKTQYSVPVGPVLPA